MRPTSALRGRVAVVTGSTRGLGLIIAASLAQAGASIVICGREMAGVEAVYGQLAAIPGVEVLGAACDVRRRAEVEEMAAQALDRFGRIDIWINNAAITGPLQPVAEIDPEAWQAVIETNLLGTFHGSQVALTAMLPRNEGKLINVVGAGAREGQTLPPGLSAYASSKAAVLRLTEQLAEEQRASGLSILAMRPAPVTTGLLPGGAGGLPEGIDGKPGRAAGEIIEVGELAVRLAGRETDGVSGRLYDASGGLSRRLKGWLGR